MRDRLVALVALLSLAFWPGCDDGGDGDADVDVDSDTDVDTDSDGDVDSDGDARADGDVDGDVDDGGGTGTLGVTVTAMPTFPDWVPVPVPDAVVALDAPGGGRTELTTDPQGEVTFEGIDWAAGTASVTAWADGYGIMSSVGIEAADGDVVLNLPILAAWGFSAGSILISGTLANVDDPTHDFRVSSVEGPSVVDEDTNWALRVAAGFPLTVVATESSTTDNPAVHGYDRQFHGWIVQAVGPFAADTTVPLDFATAATPTTVGGTIAVPTRADSPLRDAYFTGHVVQWLAGAPDYWGPWMGEFGGMSHVERAADGSSYSYDMEFVSPSSVTEAATYLDLELEGWFSAVVMAGYPTPGSQACEFLDMPNIISPARPSSGHPLHDPIEWESFNPEATPLLAIMGGDNFSLPRWVVSAPPGSTTLTVPEPPTGADLEALLSRTGVVDAIVALMTHTPTESCRFRWVATEPRSLALP